MKKVTFSASSVYKHETVREDEEDLVTGLPVDGAEFTSNGIMAWCKDKM